MNVRPSDLIQRAMRLVGAIGVGRTITQEEQADGLTAMNGVLDLWATQRLAIYEERRSVFSLTSGTQIYTIGSGGTFNVPRPDFLSRASILYSSNPGPLELPIQVLSTQDWQRDIPVKTVAGALPTAVYYDFAFPLGSLTFWPKPNQSGLQTALYLPTPISTFANATTAVDLPPGYADALTFETAIRIAAEYGLDVPTAVLMQAAEATANVKRANIRREILRCDRAITVRRGGRYNWLTDQGA